MKITQLYIKQSYAEILQHLCAVTALENWSIKPQKIMLTQHKTKYGMADLDGVVYVNQAFINSTAHRLLDATIRHELAHLCVGLKHGHNTVFKAKAKQFKATFGKHLKQESQQINQAIGFQYHLYAVLVNGEHVLIRKAHRKHKKYTAYKAGRFRYLTIKGQKVHAFKYCMPDECLDQNTHTDELI